MSNTRKGYGDYQQRATEFSVGDVVFPFMSGNGWSNGRVVAVWPGIGMVDVEWPHGSERMPVEDLQLFPNGQSTPPMPEHDNVPGGAESVSVPGGPKPSVKKASTSARRVAEAFVKQSLYWGARDRKYRLTKSELESGRYGCPKCKAEGVVLKKVNYKRNGGVSEHLLGCPACLFVIKRCDLIGLPSDEGVA